jgi:hypothetical protein
MKNKPLSVLADELEENIKSWERLVSKGIPNPFQKLSGLVLESLKAEQKIRLEDCF